MQFKADQFQDRRRILWFCPPALALCKPHKTPHSPKCSLLPGLSFIISVTVTDATLISHSCASIRINISVYISICLPSFWLDLCLDAPQRLFRLFFDCVVHFLSETVRYHHLQQAHSGANGVTDWVSISLDVCPRQHINQALCSHRLSPGFVVGIVF